MRILALLLAVALGAFLPQAGYAAGGQQTPDCLHQASAKGHQHGHGHAPAKAARCQAICCALHCTVLAVAGGETVLPPSAGGPALRLTGQQAEGADIRPPIPPPRV